jgi:MFS family permease
MQKILSLLPIDPKALGSAVVFLSVIGLFEAVRSGFFWVYLSYIKGPNLDAVAIGLAFTVHLLAETLSKSLGGYFAERWGLGILTVLSGLSIALCVYTAPLGSVWLFAAGIAWGFFYSGLGPGIMTYVSHVAVPGREGRALAYAGMYAAPWVGLGLIGGNALVRQDPALLQQALLVLAALGGALGIFLFRFRIKQPAKEAQYYPWQRLLVFIPAAFGQTFGFAIFSQLFSRYADKELGLDLLELMALLVIAGLVNFVGTGYLGRIADRGRPQLMLLLGTLLISAAFILVAQKPPFPLLVLVAILAGTGNAMFVPSWSALVVRLLPQQNRAAVWGTLMTVEGFGTSLGPPVGGWLAIQFGITAPFYGGAACFLALAIFYAFVRNPTKTP